MKFIGRGFTKRDLSCGLVVGGSGEGGGTSPRRCASIAIRRAIKPPPLGQNSGGSMPHVRPRAVPDGGDGSMPHVGGGAVPPGDGSMPHVCPRARQRWMFMVVCGGGSCYWGGRRR
jgi:hypothetical protein